jgi:hypothetical protein
MMRSNSALNPTAKQLGYWALFARIDASRADARYFVLAVRYVGDVGHYCKNRLSTARDTG